MRRKPGPRVPPPDPRIRGAIGDGRTRVLLAVLGGATLYDELTEATGFARSTVHEHLRRLKAAGLVTWEEAPAGPFGARTLQGTTRPLVRAVPFGG